MNRLARWWETWPHFVAFVYGLYALGLGWFFGLYLQVRIWWSERA